MANPVVEFETSLGSFSLELDSQKAPITADNFLRYVESGHYEGTLFHRVIDGFMVQGGGLDESMQPKPTEKPIKNEGTNGLKNEPMTVAMARTNDPDSATCQFFINLEDNRFLNAGPGNDGYAVFASVVEGEETIRKMAKVETGTLGFHENVPKEPIVIQKVQKKAK